MGLQPLYMAPGICKTSSPYSSGKTVEYGEGRIATGRYVDCNLVRFTAGFPEKLGGWENAQTEVISPNYGQNAYGTSVYQTNGNNGPNLQVDGVPYSILSWRDNNGVVRAAIATNLGLFTYDGETLTDITPLQVVSITLLGGVLIPAGYGQLAYGYLLYGNPTGKPGTYTTGSAFTTAGSTNVTIVDGDGTIQQVGDFIKVIATYEFNGVALQGLYEVISTDPINKQFVINTNQVATGTGYGGGEITLYYTRYNVTNAFSTTVGSSSVNVTLQTGNGAKVGQQIIFSNGSVIGGVSIQGQFPITAVSGNVVTFTATTVATSTVTNVGGKVSYSIGVAINPITYTAPISQIAPTVGWTLARYGQQLLACPVGGTIYVYDPTVGSVAYPLSGAPSSILAMIVTPERFVVALGVSVGGLEIAWADQNDYTDWITSETNTAESGRTLQGGNYFVGGAPVRDGVSLIITDRTCFQMNYSGDTFIYDTPVVGDNCGLISPRAITASGETAYWMSDKDFWMWTGTATPMPSDDIRDYVYNNLNKLYRNKCWAGMNRAKREVWFGYPAGTATECSNYVIFHIDQQCWSIGTLNRTAWTDADLIQYPAAGDSNGYIYLHELGVDAGSVAMDSYIEAAPVDVSNGDANVDMFGFIPDFERLTGNIALTINTQYYPNDPISADGPYTLTDVNNGATRIDLRSDGKLMGFKMESNVLGGDYRLGLSRADVQPSGARR